MSFAIYDVLQVIIDLLFVAVLMGFIVYTLSPKVETWEMGVMKVFTFVFEVMYEGFTGRSSTKTGINAALILSNEEVRELIRRFNNHPYDVPVIQEYQPNVNEISWYNCVAFGMVREYAGLTYAETIRMCTYLIQQYFIETRNIAPEVYIKVASATRLYFAIPLSEKAREYLEQQEKTQVDLSEEKVPTVLEMEVDIFSDEESDDDIRI